MSLPQPDERPYWLIPAKDLPKHPEPDMTPLSEAECEDLRRRLDAPGGWRLKLTPREQAAHSRMGIIRPPADVTRIETKVRDDLFQQVGVQQTPQTSFEWGMKQYSEGILAALVWATGRVAEAPLSHKVIIRPTTSEMELEAILGQEIGEGRRESIYHRSYGIGVEATLMWLYAGTDDPPI